MNIRLILSTGLVLTGFLVGGAAVESTIHTDTAHVQYLADYGSNETAEIAGEHARDAGVRHNPDVHHHRN